MCIPLPLEVVKGLGMKDAYTPCCCASSLMTSRAVITLSAMVKRVGVLQVDFVLTRRAFVVRVFDRNTHFGKIEHRVTAQVRSRVAGKLVIVSVGVQRLGGVRVLKVEILQLRPHVIDVAKAGQPLQVALQDIARVSDERLSPWSADVAEYARHRVAPGDATATT